MRLMIVLAWHSTCLNQDMKPFLVLYATRHGHTRRVARFICERLSAHNQANELIDVAQQPADLRLADYGAAIVISAVYGGKHDRRIVNFIRTHRPDLDRLPTAFLSISLTQATVDDPGAPQDRRVTATTNVERIIAELIDSTGWHPSTVKPLAGALLYSKYNIFLRHLMRWISARSGGDTDLGSDYEYTDWRKVEAFVSEFGSSFAPPPSSGIFACTQTGCTPETSLHAEEQRSLQRT
jgi:menaquinone-dependent protoporphyrinogen oxidase